MEFHVSLEHDQKPKEQARSSLGPVCPVLLQPLPKALSQDQAVMGSPRGMRPQAGSYKSGDSQMNAKLRAGPLAACLRPNAGLYYITDIHVLQRYCQRHMGPVRCRGFESACQRSHAYAHAHMTYKNASCRAILHSCQELCMIRLAFCIWFAFMGSQSAALKLA